jgi:hypothetical protein
VDGLAGPLALAVLEEGKEADGPFCRLAVPAEAALVPALQVVEVTLAGEPDQPPGDGFAGDDGLCVLSDLARLGLAGRSTGANQDGATLPTARLACDAHAFFPARNCSNGSSGSSAGGVVNFARPDGSSPNSAENSLIVFVARACCTAAGCGTM